MRRVRTRDTIVPRGAAMLLYPFDGSTPERWVCREEGIDPFFTLEGGRVIGAARLSYLLDDGALYFEKEASEMANIPLADRACDLVLRHPEVITDYPHTGEGESGEDFVPLSLVAQAYSLNRKPMRRRLDAYGIPYVVRGGGVVIDRAVALDLAAHAQG